MPDTLSISHALTIPPGKVRCYITGILRRETPEEHVRQRVARSLVEEYKYPVEDVQLSFPVRMGRGRKEADIAVFLSEADRTQENIHLIIETKREEIKPTDRENGIDQLKSYLAASPNAQYGIWVGSQLIALKKRVEKGRIVFEETTDIPQYGSARVSRITFDKLIPAQEGLRAVFKRCHNYIAANQGLPKSEAFQELLKLIFCKVHDERTASREMMFSIEEDERRSDLGQRKLEQRISDLFSEVREGYSYIFPQDEPLRLNKRVLAYIVSELQKYSLLQTVTDVKGEAYEEIVGANLRGDRGEFFTPRNVCALAVDIIFSTYPDSQRTRLKVIDPACGTGGFLVSVMNYWRQIIKEREEEKWKKKVTPVIEKYVAEGLLEACRNNLHGIDFNPFLARAAQMNLVMNGDGSTNVFSADSLLPSEEWPDEEPNNVRSKVKLGAFDVVFTNPPFGTNLAIDDPHILQQFEMSTWGAERSRSSLSPEQLFIERCYQFLKPGGKMAIVLPDSILSNPGLKFLRDWILKRMKVMAVIDLPQETFEPFTGTQTSLLIAQRKSEELMKQEARSKNMVHYPIFMGVAKNVGHDRRGNPTFQRTPEGEILEREVLITLNRLSPSGELFTDTQKKIMRERDDDLPEIAREFREWISTQDLS